MKKLLVLGLVLAFAPAALATTYIDDDFEGYASQAAFNATWLTSSGTQPIWSTDQSVSPTHSVYEPSGSPGRVWQVFDPANGANGTVAQPLEFSFDIYINPDDLTSSRRYLELREADGGAGNIFALGLTNLGSLDNTKFGFRNSFTWTQLSAPRLAGWNHVEALITDTEFKISINSEPTETFTRNNLLSYGSAFIGSGYSNNTVTPFDGFTYVDNVFVGNVPEPATLALLGFGGLALLRRKR